MRMREEFFRSGRFFGVDIKKAALEQASSRTQVFLGDQKDPELLSRVVQAAGPLDIVIDDGSHRGPDQPATLLYLWPRLKPAGWYVMEDTLTSYLERWGMRYRQMGTTMEFLKNIMDDLHVKWHKQTPTLADVAALHFYPDTCLIRKNAVG
jgi:8-demethyl-8-alpha-L-rhamnosyltetracenomycin-C 2'-O-methyltransferase